MKSLRIALLCVCASAVWAAARAHACAASPAGGSASPQTTASGSTTVKKKTKKKRAKRQPTQQAPTPDRISEIQSALARGGYYEGGPNGKWDANTVAAVEKFQSAHGIEASGKLDAPTLQKLGLGSEIAGVSAPKPIQPASCCAASAPSAPASAPSPSPNSSALPPAGSQP